MMMTMMMITKAESWLSLSCCGWQADVAKFAENVHVALHLFSGVAVCLFFRTLDLLWVISLHRAKRPDDCYLCLK